MHLSHSLQVLCCLLCASAITSVLNLLWFQEDLWMLSDLAKS